MNNDFLFGHLLFRLMKKMKEGTKTKERTWNGAWKNFHFKRLNFGSKNPYTTWSKSTKSSRSKTYFMSFFAEHILYNQKRDKALNSNKSIYIHASFSCVVTNIISFFTAYLQSNRYTQTQGKSIDTQFNAEQSSPIYVFL